MTYQLIVQDEGSNDVVLMEGNIAREIDALQKFADETREYEVIATEDCTLDEARAELDIDGRIVAAVWIRIDDAPDVRSLIAVVEEV